MNKTEMLEHLEKWQNTIQQMNEKEDAVYKLLGVAPECDLMSAVYDLKMRYTETLAALLGDSAETLEYFWLELQFGKQNYGNMIIAGTEYPIRTLSDLADAIIAIRD